MTISSLASRINVDTIAKIRSFHRSGANKDRKGVDQPGWAGPGGAADVLGGPWRAPNLLGGAAVGPEVAVDQPQRRNQSRPSTAHACSASSGVAAATTVPPSSGCRPSGPAITPPAASMIGINATMS